MMYLGIISSLLWWAVIIFVIVKLASGSRKKHYSWLQRELPLWEEKNIVNKEQGDAVLSLYKLKRVTARKKMDMVKVLTLIGVIFVGLGVIFFVGSNWQRIPSHIRTIMLLAITITTLYEGYFFSYEKEGFVNLGKSLLLLASLFWGGTIALIGQIYNIPTSENWYIMLLWAFPIVPIAILFKNDYVHILASVLFVIWNFLYGSDNNIANYYYPSIVFLLMLPTAKNLILSRRINIIGLLSASLYCCFNKYEWLALLISAGLLVGYLAQKEERAYLYAACLSFIFWDITYFTVRQLQPNLYFLLPLGFMLYLTYRDNIEKNLVFCLAGLMIGINLALSSVSQIVNYPFNGLQFTIFQLLLGLSIYSVGIASRNREYLFPVIYKIIGYLVTFICVYLLAFKALLGEWGGAANNVYLFGSLILAGIIALLVVDERRSGNFNNKSSLIELAALVVALVGSIILLVSPRTVLLNTITMNSVLVVFALSSIFLGVELKKPPIFTLGIVLFALFIITRYIDVTWALKEKSLFFIVGGLVILFLGTFLEKQRRKIIERMKPE
ncbi:MAG: DUF2157 domain-containing protein [Candidatus Omnitrophota bacterium]|nr:DUF2157 domain-containing protein [Candidatus Omnitrophota bacterium]